MPLYEYRCLSCAKDFELLVYPSEKPRCPTCQGTRLEKKLSVFAVAGSSKDSLPDFSGSPCGSCGDPRGPGACSSDG